MRRVALSLLLVALVLPLAASAVGGAALRIVDRSPLVVQGSGFKRLEPLTVTAIRRQGPLVRRLVATRAGSFSVRFATTVEWCGGAREIRAVGRKGSTAVLTLRPDKSDCAELGLP
jgi:hypothetical protein